VVEALEAVGLLIVVGVDVAIATVTIRFFRLRLATRWGRAFYTLVLTPPLLIAVLLLLSGPFGLGGDVGGPGSAVVIGIVLPLGLGASIERFWMPPPDAVAD